MDENNLDEETLRDPNLEKHIEKIILDLENLEEFLSEYNSDDLVSKIHRFFYFDALGSFYDSRGDLLLSYNCDEITVKSLDNTTIDW